MRVKLVSLSIHTTWLPNCELGHLLGFKLTVCIQSFWSEFKVHEDRMMEFLRMDMAVVVCVQDRSARAKVTLQTHIESIFMFLH